MKANEFNDVLREYKLEEIVSEIRRLQIGESSGHDWYHTLRVMKNAYEITVNNEEDVNMYLVLISSLLHDVADHKFGYSDQDRTQIIANYFKTYNLDNSILEQCTHIINNMSYSKNYKFSLLEGQIVQDADRLDALGYIGIARTFAYGGLKGRTLYDTEVNSTSSLQHFDDKLFKILDLINTDYAREIAVRKNKVLEDFKEGFLKEWDCE